MSLSQDERKKLSDKVADDVFHEVRSTIENRHRWTHWLATGYGLTVMTIILGLVSLFYIQMGDRGSAEEDDLKQLIDKTQSLLTKLDNQKTTLEDLQKDARTTLVEAQSLQRKINSEYQDHKRSLDKEASTKSTLSEIQKLIHKKNIATQKFLRDLLCAQGNKPSTCMKNSTTNYPCAERNITNCLLARVERLLYPVFIPASQHSEGINKRLESRGYVVEIHKTSSEYGTQELITSDARVIILQEYTPIDIARELIVESRKASDALDHVAFGEKLHKPTPLIAIGASLDIYGCNIKPLSDKDFAILESAQTNENKFRDLIRGSMRACEPNSENDTEAAFMTSTQ